MAEVLGAISAVIALVETTTKVLNFVTQFAVELRQGKPTVVIQAIKQLRIWEQQLNSLRNISHDENNKDLIVDLEASGVLDDAQECLEQLHNIIKKVMPDRHTSVALLLGQIAFHLRERKKDIEGILENLNAISNHIQLKLQSITQ